MVALDGLSDFQMTLVSFKMKPIWKVSTSKINTNRLVFSRNMGMNFLELGVAICNA